MRLTIELRTDRVDAQGRRHLRLRIEHKGRQQRMGTGITVKPDEWDAARQRVRASHPAHRAINDRLAALVIAVEASLVRGDWPARAGAPDGGALWERWEALVVASHPKPETLRARRVVIASLRSYAPDARLTDVSRTWLLGYAGWLREQGYKPNTIADRVRRTRQVVEQLRAQDGLPGLPELRRLGVKGEDTGYKHLSREQAEALMAVVPKGKWERLALDLWTFSFYTGGMRFGDLVRLDRSMIHGGEIHYRQAKTGAVRVVPILPQAQAVLDRYPGKKLWNPLAKGGPDALRWGANVLVNRALKVLARRAGIDLPVSMHWARHSFAEWAMERGVHPVVMQQILGHAKFSTTEVYLSRFNRRAVTAAFGVMFGSGDKGHERADDGGDG